MLNKLLACALIQMGVANVTPICDNAKNPITINNENVVTDYELTLNQRNQTSQVYQNAETGGAIAVGKEKETIINYRGNNVALNVQATEYTTEVTYINNDNQMYAVNYYWYNSSSAYNLECATRKVIVMQLNAYNYNRDTETNINLSIDLQDSYSSGEYIYIDKIYYVKSVYTCTQNEWASLLSRQLKKFGAYDIIATIEDPDNNYYYVKQTEWIESNADDTDTTEINLIPNQNNYIVIDYMPVIKATLDDGHYYEPSASTKTLYYDYTNGFKASTYKITGTNIIPDGTYEVIDIPGLMWEIITMPFAFVSQAFNLTLFPGTPYQLNISNLFLSIIAVFVFVALISMFLKMKG